MNEVIKVLEREINVINSFIEHVEDSEYVKLQTTEQRRNEIISEYEAKKVPFQQAILILNGETVKRSEYCDFNASECSQQDSCNNDICVKNHHIA